MVSETDTDFTGETLKTEYKSKNRALFSVDLTGQPLTRILSRESVLLVLENARSFHKSSELNNKMLNQHSAAQTDREKVILFGRALDIANGKRKNTDSLREAILVLAKEAEAEATQTYQLPKQDSDDSDTENGSLSDQDLLEAEKNQIAIVVTFVNENTERWARGDFKDSLAPQPPKASEL